MCDLLEIEVEMGRLDRLERDLKKTRAELGSVRQQLQILHLKSRTPVGSLLPAPLRLVVKVEPMEVPS